MLYSLKIETIMFMLCITYKITKHEAASNTIYIVVASASVSAYYKVITLTHFDCRFLDNKL